MGPAQSARGIQLGRIWDGRPAVGGSPRGTPPPALLAGPGRAHFLRGGASRPAPGRLGRARGRRWLAASPPRALQRPSARTSRRFPGPWTRVLAAPSRVCRRPPLVRFRGRCGASAPGRGPPPPARLSTGAYCPQCAPTASRRPGRGPAHVRGARGLRRCRLPTRPVLKHGPRSLTHARVRGLRSRNPVAQ